MPRFCPPSASKRKKTLFHLVPSIGVFDRKMAKMHMKQHLVCSIVRVKQNDSSGRQLQSDGIVLMMYAVMRSELRGKTANPIPIVPQKQSFRPGVEQSTWPSLIVVIDCESRLSTVVFFPIQYNCEPCETPARGYGYYTQSAGCLSLHAVWPYTAFPEPCPCPIFC